MYSMNQEDYGMGGSVVSYSQQQRINTELTEFELHLKQKQRKTNPVIKHQPNKPLLAESINIDNTINMNDTHCPYTTLLHRVYTSLSPQNNPNDDNDDNSSISSSSPSNPKPDRGRIPEPKLGLIGSRKTIWINYQIICRALHRDPNHLKQFIETELITNTNFNGERQLILSGRWTPKKITNILKQYVNGYVLCENCRGLDTLMKRNNSTRLYELECNKCLSHRTCKRIERAFRTIGNHRDRIIQKQNEQNAQNQRRNPNKNKNKYKNNNNDDGD